MPDDDEVTRREDFMLMKMSGIGNETELQHISFAVGETIVEFLDRGARSFTVLFGKDSIEIRCDKGFHDLEELVKQHGYDANRRYKSLWEDKRDVKER